MQKIKAIYDAPDYVDRYTIYFGGMNKVNKLHDCLTLSACPESPQGFSQFGMGELGAHNGKKLTFNQLPHNIQAHAVSRGLQP